MVLNRALDTYITLLLTLIVTLISLNCICWRQLALPSLSQKYNLCYTSLSWTGASRLVLNRALDTYITLLLTLIVTLISLNCICWRQLALPSLSQKYNLCYTSLSWTGASRLVLNRALDTYITLLLTLIVTLISLNCICWRQLALPSLSQKYNLCYTSLSWTGASRLPNTWVSTQEKPLSFLGSIAKSIFLTARLAASEVADRDLAESVLSSTYWGREDDLDIEYSLIFKKMPT